MMERFSSLVTKSRPWPVIGRTIFFTSDKNRPTRDEIYFIDFWRENLSMYRIKDLSSDTQIRVIGSTEHEICTEMLTNLRGKLRAKFPLTTLGYPVARISHLEDASSGILELGASPVEGLQLQQKCKKRRKRGQK